MCVIWVLASLPSLSGKPHSDTRAALLGMETVSRCLEKQPPACIPWKTLSSHTAQVFLGKVQKVFVWIIHAFVILDLQQSGGFRGGRRESSFYLQYFFFSLYATMFQKCILFGFILFLKQYSVPLVLQILTNIIYKKLTVYSDCEKTYLWFYLKHILSPREVFSFVYTR